MKKLALTDGDLIVSILSGDGANGIEIPLALADKPVEELRVKGGKVRHLSEFTTFYVDVWGVRHLEAGAGRVQVAGAWNAPLIRTADGWRVEQLADKLRAYAAAARYRREAGGVTIGGAEIRTDRESQGLIAGALLRAQINAEATFQFKTATGFVTLSGAQMQAIAVAVGEHVQACFAKEAEVLAAIDAGTITTVAEIDQRFAAL
jgi:hypothetical protein